MIEHFGKRLLLKAWPFRRGAGRIVDVMFSSIEFEAGSTIITTTDNFRMTIPTNELIGRHLYLTGEFDRSIVEVLLFFAKPGDVLLDIGANIGYVSACFLQNIPGSTVLCVEPLARNTDFLWVNLAPFVTRFSIFQTALSDKTSEGWIEIWDNNLAASRLVPERTSRSIRAAIQSTNEFLAGIDEVHIIKIDAEGHEDRILSDAKEQLDRLRPRVVVFEHEGTQAAFTGSIGSLLGRLGYNIFGIKKGLIKLRLVPIRIASDCLYNDYVAIRQGI
jgi:FkbM family methyltransferase